VAGITGTHALGPASGRVLIKTGRAGLAARAGHDLTIEITRWSASVTVPADDDGGITAAAVSAELDLGSLTVRTGTGGAKPLSDRDRGDIHATARKILGKGATATFTSSRVIPASGGGAIEGTLTLHGTPRPVRLQVTSPEPNRYRGTAVVRQSDFGITPYSGFLGALKLKDEVTVEFEVLLSETPNGQA
jgi:polyisoprenoid-binding protein YceI